MIFRARPNTTRTRDDIWATATDLMSGLLMAFVLLVTVTLVRMGVVVAAADGDSLEESQREVLQLREVERSLSQLLSERDQELAAAEARLVSLRLSLTQVEQLREELTTLRPLASTPRLLAMERARAHVMGAVSQALRQQHLELMSRAGGWSRVAEGRERVLDRVESLSRSLGVGDEDLRRGAVPIPSDVLFSTNEHELSPEGESFLAELIPRLAHELLEDRSTRGLVHRIIIEGHSSRKGRPTYNMRLSALRAVSVYRFITRDLGDFPHKATLLTLLAPTARGAIESRGMNPDDDDPRDRRVDLRVEFAAIESLP